MENTSLSGEIIKVLEYITDKFNIMFEIPSEQIMKFSEQLARKIVMWELLSKSFNLVFMILLLSTSIIIFRKLNRKYGIINTIKKIYSYEKEVKHIELSILHIMWFIVLSTVSTLQIISDIKQIVQCIILPEKVVLDFISTYIN